MSHNKTKLKELLDKERMPDAYYHTFRDQEDPGPEHKPNFLCSLKVGTEIFKGKSVGQGKKKAEDVAAGLAYRYLLRAVRSVSPPTAFRTDRRSDVTALVESMVVTMDGEMVTLVTVGGASLVVPVTDPSLREGDKVNIQVVAKCASVQ